MGDSITIDDVISDLRLGEYREDWDIINADGSRLAEFVGYVFARVQRMEDDVQGELLELVLDSANRAVREGGTGEWAAGEVRRTLAAVGRGEMVKLVLEYWRRYWGKGTDDRMLPLFAAIQDDPSTAG